LPFLRLPRACADGIRCTFGGDHTKGHVAPHWQFNFVTAEDRAIELAMRMAMEVYRRAHAGVPLDADAAYEVVMRTWRDYLPVAKTYRPAKELTDADPP
jgi:hypothetical protein